MNFLSSKLEQMAEVFNCHGSSHGRARDKKTKVKKGKKDRNKNRHSFDVQSLGQFKTLDQIPRFEYILSPHPAAAYHWDCQSNSLTEYATFFFFSFLSMEFIAELPYKSPRLSGCFHTFSFLTIILKTFQDPTTAKVTRSSKTYNRVNIKNNFALQPLFLYTFFAVTAYLRRENA